MQPMDIVLKFQLDKRTVKTPGGVTTSMHGIWILKKTRLPFLLQNLQYHNTASDLNINMKKTYSKNIEYMPKILDIPKAY